MFGAWWIWSVRWSIFPGSAGDREGKHLGEAAGGLQLAQGLVARLAGSEMEVQRLHARVAPHDGRVELERQRHVGPSAEILETLGDKTAARKLAALADVPVLPGTDEPVSDTRKARLHAKEIGFPLIIKAAFGGGGRGMRVVNSPDEFDGQLEEASKEAQAAFGNGAVFLERYIRRARHIEIQILGDLHGHILHLYERDCSVQRRHQKVVEVAPALNLHPQIRQEIAEAAVAIAREAGYYNAGTVEFLVDADTGELLLYRSQPAHPGGAYRNRNGSQKNFR